MAAEHQYFYEDEVYRINKKGNIEFGMVLENSELVSSDENSDVEEGGRMKKGHIRVAWHPTGVEEVIPERKVHLADRSLMPGDVVRRMIKGKDTQRGYCRDIKVTASVQVVGTKQVIPNVKSENLIPLEEFATDIAACLDSWVGGIKTVHSKLLIQCSDGSRCIINDIEASGLEDFNEKRDCDCEFPGHRDDFYPGQTLWGPLHCLEEAEWIHCTKELKAQRAKANKIIKVVVEEVQTDSVGVHWQCRAYSKDGAGAEKEQPKFLVQGEDLKRLRLLNVFEPCTLQVGDRNFYSFREDDTIVMKEQWRRSQRDLVLAGNSVTNGPASTLLDKSKISSPKKNKDTVGGTTESSNQESPARTGVQGTVDNNQSAMAVQPVVPTVEVTNGSPTPGADSNTGVEHLDDWDTEDTASVSDTASISSGCSSVGSQGKKKRGPALMTKVLKKKKLRRTRKRAPPVALQPGQRVVVETLSTSSIADVVWQDGSVEYGIPSTQLYPIHHLDDQEFFPGDFVIENKDESCMRVYGVVQSVDHAGRTATVKWFKTYTSVEEPCPAMLEENEVSVYDLKDHPDFQYRPGTVVIRVANFEGEDANCTAGQVLDNYPEGMVRVWWVDGHVSMSWPQDLYKVGEYDSDEGELWDDGSSDASWETESEDCFIADDVCPEEDLEEMLKPKLAANIEKARIAMSRLEEIFTQNPSLQTTSVMRQLLDVYKDCRYLDKLMGTSFFHESHFQGLLERVRERGRANVAQRVADQVSRLFHQSDASDQLMCNSVEENKLGNKISDPRGITIIGSAKHSEVGVAKKQEGVMQNVSEVSAREGKGRQSANSVTLENSGDRNSGSSSSPVVIVDDCNDNSAANISKDSGCGSSGNNDSFSSMEFLRENFLNMERRVVTAANNRNNLHEVDDGLREIVKEQHSTTTTKSGAGSGQRTNGNYNNNKLHAQSDERSGGVGNTAKHNGCYASSTTGVISKSRHTASATAEPQNSRRLSDAVGGQTSTPSSTSLVSNSHVCVKLCSLIKAQLVKAHGEVTRRFGGNQGLMTLSDAFNTRSPIDSGSHKDENETEEEESKIDVGKKRGKETLVPSDTTKPERAWDSPETQTSDAEEVKVAVAQTTEIPLLSEKVKDGLMDMFHALSRLGGSQTVPSQNQTGAKVAEVVEKEETPAVSTAVAAAATAAAAPAPTPTPPPPPPPSAPALAVAGNKDEQGKEGQEDDAEDSCGEGFSIMDSAPNSHKFKLTMFQPTDPQNFFRTVRKEIKLLRSSLPPGIWVKGFEDRMDLYSVMIRGPEKTPYEDGLFFFDFQLSADYPKAPPLCHYISYCSDRLNPNLYEDGKVCVSLLGTWSGKGTEVWTLHSNLLQVIVSIQGLILVSEPYFNEAGYEKQKGSQQGKENSRMYNEMAVLKLVQSLTKLILQPPPVFQEEILQHFRQNAYKLLNRLDTWLEISERYNSTHPITPTTPTSFREIHGQAISNALNAQLPEFPLIPASKGFCLTLRKTLVMFRDVLSSVGIREDPTS
ncbi:(E3-independent) E2 ubiquitin-conjugating enzyme UBE2O isoform X2 [Periplaneta americana]|uniref:(E3-independent) E2 ubiquitin-conjugating enzyme UBE2O isoform X2 n=1 Tax=Periplaneta americana TaxID=6978 RepID=UPI0037E870CB